MYGARSKFSRGKSTWAFSFDSCSEPRQVNRLRCRQRTGGNDCSLVFLTVLATLPQWSHEYIAEPDRISSRVCTAKHCWSVAQPPGPSPGSTVSPASGEGRLFSFEKQTRVWASITDGIVKEMSKKGSSEVFVWPHRRQWIRLRTVPPNKRHTGSKGNPNSRFMTDKHSNPRRLASDMLWSARVLGFNSALPGFESWWMAWGKTVSSRFSPRSSGRPSDDCSKVLHEDVRLSSFPCFLLLDRHGRQKQPFLWRTAPQREMMTCPSLSAFSIATFSLHDKVLLLLFPTVGDPSLANPSASPMVSVTQCCAG